MEESGKEISYTRIFRVFVLSWREIVLSFIVLVIFATAYASVADKEYLVRGTVKQTDLSTVLPPESGIGGALGALAIGANLNDRINSYVSVFASPEIGSILLRHDDFISVLFDDKWERRGKDWVHKDSIGWAIRNAACDLFQIECSQTLSPIQVSTELQSRLAIQPSETIVQGVLTNIGNTDTYDIEFRGKSPDTVVRMVDFLNRAANDKIQNDEIVRAEAVVGNLSGRANQIANDTAKSQIIFVLASEEKKLAVLRSGDINYAASWLIAPTISSWPVKPNIPLLYVLAIVASFVVGPALRLGRRKFIGGRKAAYAA